jgi:hypothetical protein
MNSVLHFDKPAFRPSNIYICPGLADEGIDSASLVNYIQLSSWLRLVSRPVTAWGQNAAKNTLASEKVAKKERPD